MSIEERDAKYFDCLAYAGYPDEVANRLLETMEYIEDVDDLSSRVNLYRRLDYKQRKDTAR